jgi:short-subunit dehydrogenase
VLLSLSAERVARAGHDGFMRRKRVVVPGIGNRIAVLLTRVVRDAVLLPLLYRGTRFAARES